MNRLTSSTVLGAAPQGFTYDLSGNITSKTGNGNYHYLTNNVKQPHAVATIDGMSGSFSYDADGNQLTGNGRTTTWNSFDMPLTITRGGNSSTFTYGPDHERTTQLENNAGKQSRVFYGGAQEVQLDGNNNLVSIKTYWPTGIGVEIDRPSQSTTELDWTHEDRLGSIVAITDAKGNLKEAMGFDAWGSRRSAVGTTPVGPTTTQVTETTDDKGFTGQEMLDPVELVHLNGRVYDPLVGKFVSGDPMVGDPLNGQNYNRYTYVLNNPTNDTDPTGFDEVKIQPTAPPTAILDAFADGATSVSVVNGSSTTTFTPNGDGTYKATTTTGSSNGGAPTSQPGAAVQGKGAGENSGFSFSKAWDVGKGMVIGAVDKAIKESYENAPIGPDLNPVAPALSEKYGPYQSMLPQPKNNEQQFGWDMAVIPSILINLRSPAGEFKTAEQAADAARALGKMSGAAAELRVGEHVFTGVSGEIVPHHPDVTGALMGTPEAARKPWHGGCAEIVCLDKARNAGVNPSGGTIRAVNIGESGAGHNTPKVICSSCMDVLKFLGVKQ